MSYNIEYGGIKLYKNTGNMNYVNKYIDLIKRNKIDIVSFQECKMRDIDISKIIAEKLGYYHRYFLDVTNFYKKKYYHQSIISRYPFDFSDDTNNICGVNIKGVVINIVNIHLDDEPYIPYSIKGIKYTNTPINITNNSDKSELSFITKRNTINELMRDKRVLECPTIIMGDFNEPSHLDYKYIRWKSSINIIKHGFVDVARYIYKDIKKYPLYTVDLYDKNYSPERIDIMYCNNGLKPVSFTNIYNKMSDHIPIVGVFEIVGKSSISSVSTKSSRTKKPRKTNNNTKKISKL
jgi:exonuclease III